MTTGNVPSLKWIVPVPRLPTCRARATIRYGLLAVAGCGALLLIVGIAVVFGVQRTDLLAEQQEAVGSQLFGVRQVFETLLVMESSQRGYLLTRDPAYLEPYREEDQAFTNTFAKFDELFHDNTAAAEVVDDIRRLARAKRNELAQTLLDQRRYPGIAKTSFKNPDLFGTILCSDVLEN